MAVTMNPTPFSVFDTSNNGGYEMSPSFLSSKSFDVKNIDDKGRIIHYGSLEISEFEIVFRYEHHRSISRWPLTCIRRYGVSLEGNVFAFEAGRRAPEGEGLYAFQTNGEQACEIRQRVDYFTQYKPM